jgi:4-methylaminobutanoate oxidase (formaldehyde-forming)
MHDQARVVILGSGIAGSSIAYHLIGLGVRDVVVLEQGPLIHGTTSHAPGLVGQIRSSESLTRMLMYSVALYKQLSVGGVPGFMEVGSLRLASSKARMLELERQARFAKGLGLSAELLGAEEAQRLFPLMSTEGVHGALYLPSDGSARAPILAEALANAARERGATFYDHTRVTGIEVESGRVQAVTTDKGRIRTEVVVVAAGIWSPLLGRMAGVSIPLVPMQHQYVATAPVAELRGGVSVPNLRDPDKLVYFRQDGERLVMGGYERDPRSFAVEAIPERNNPTVHGFDALRFESLLALACERVPGLLSAALDKRINGLESFTPDGDFILGEAPEVSGFWAACGFCAHGVSGSGGVGKMVAEWIVEGKPSEDLSAMDIRRFGGRAIDAPRLVEQVVRVYGTYYDLPEAASALQ